MLADLVTQPIERYTPAQVRDEVLRAAGGSVIGYSEAGRPIVGAVIGGGPRRVSLITGNHSDEPVGSETLRVLAEGLSRSSLRSEPGLLDEYTFVIVGHGNPDGEAQQLGWMGAWPDPLACLRHEFREKPGRDVEFGYPAMRAENEAVAGFLAGHGPYAMHLSLHGMTVSEGGYHLIERSWVDRTQNLREQYAQAMHDAGLTVLFDWDRGGEKGFDYIGPGFATTPRSDAMREHFEALGDHETAGKFHLNSMEYVRTLGGDPLCMVTELPLFVVKSHRAIEPPSQRGVPAVYMGFRQAVNAAREALGQNDLAGVLEAVADYELTPVDITTAVRLQLTAIGLGLEAIG